MIVPVYNVAPYLAACLDSILAQTFRDFELILVEDGSTDGSRAIAESYAAKDARVRLVEHRWNHGATLARNLALELSLGKYVAFVDSDDIVYPNYLAVLHHAAETSGADMVQAGFQTFFEVPGDGRGYAWTKRPGFLPDTLQGRTQFFLPVRIHIAPWSKLCRRDFLDAHHLLFSDVPVAADVSFHYECLLVARRYLILPDIIYHYRQERSGSLQNVRGIQRAGRYVASMSRSLETFTTWIQSDGMFPDVRTQHQLRQVLYRFYLHQLRDLAKECGREEVFAACKNVLAAENHETMFESMLHDALPEKENS